MKQIFILLSLFVLTVGCERTHNAAELPISGNTGNPAPETVYSMLFGGNPNAYQNFILRDDGTFEMFASQANVGTGNLEGWVKAEGTYALVGSTLTVTASITEKGNYISQGCGDPLNFSYNLVDNGNSITLDGIFTLDDEAVSGVSKPDVSSIPNECP